MNQFLLLLALLFLPVVFCQAQKPKNGTYTYSVAYDEWNGKSLGSTCTVVIKGDSVTVIHNGTGKMTGKKGDILDKGILMKHSSGQWIIGHSPADKKAKEIGGCIDDGPTIINFTKKQFHAC